MAPQEDSEMKTTRTLTIRRGEGTYLIDEMEQVASYKTGEVEELTEALDYAVAILSDLSERGDDAAGEACEALDELRAFLVR
jgi:hypothetical protein